jgi:hypothetical protein
MSLSSIPLSRDSSDNLFVGAFNYTQCTHNRNLFFKGLDVVGYVPVLGSLSGIVRIISAIFVELFCHGMAAISSNTKEVVEDSKKSKWQFRAQYLKKEVKRGALEIIPFASIVYDCKAKSREKAFGPVADTLAFGRYYHRDINNKMCFFRNGLNIISDDSQESTTRSTYHQLSTDE